MPCTPMKTMSRWSWRSALTATGPTRASEGAHAAGEDNGLVGRTAVEDHGSSSSQQSGWDFPQLVRQVQVVVLADKLIAVPGLTCRAAALAMASFSFCC